MQGNGQSKKNQAGGGGRGSEEGISQSAGLAGSDAVAAEGAGISGAPLGNSLSGKCVAPGTRVECSGRRGIYSRVKEQEYT